MLTRLPCRLEPHRSLLGIALSTSEALQQHYEALAALSLSHRMITGQQLTARAECCFGPLQIYVGVLAKYVNFGKGWRHRLFILKGGVLRYYKVIQ